MCSNSSEIEIGENGVKGKRESKKIIIVIVIIILIMIIIIKNNLKNCRRVPVTPNLVFYVIARPKKMH